LQLDDAPSIPSPAGRSCACPLPGFTVGTKLNGVEELRKKWEEFLKKQEQERQEAATTHK
jgi:hypothetical protein